MKSKSKKLFKVFGPVACMSIAALPLAVTLTSCSATNHGGLWKLDLGGETKPTSLSANAFTKDKTSIKKYINGTTSYHEGNYCIILGCNTSKNSNKFFCGAKMVGEGLECEDYFKADSFVGGQIINVFNTTKDSNLDCGILTYFDIETASEAAKNPLNGNPLAYDYKWTSTDVETAEVMEENHDKDLDIEEGKYARNDKSAKEMRDLVHLCKQLFGDSFGCNSSSDLPYVMTWKEGVPQKDGFFTLTDSEQFHEKVIKLWEDEEEEEPESSYLM